MVDTFDSSSASMLDVGHPGSSSLASVGAHKSERAARVVWREHEKRIVAAEMRQLMRRDPRCRPLRALLQAQQVLPASRRRAIQSWAQLRPQLESYLHEPTDPQLSLDSPTLTGTDSPPAPSLQAVTEDALRSPVWPAAIQSQSGAAARAQAALPSAIGEQLRARVDGALVGLLGRAFEAGAKAALARLAGPQHATAADRPNAVAPPAVQADSADPQKLQVLVAGLFP